MFVAASCFLLWSDAEDLNFCHLPRFYFWIGSASCFVSLTALFTCWWLSLVWSCCFWMRLAAPDTISAFVMFFLAFGFCMDTLIDSASSMAFYLGLCFGSSLVYNLHSILFRISFCPGSWHWYSTQLCNAPLVLGDLTRCVYVDWWSVNVKHGVNVSACVFCACVQMFQDWLSWMVSPCGPNHGLFQFRL